MAIAILIGNVLAAAFLLRAFQQIFIATPKRVHQLTAAHIIQSDKSALLP